MWALTVQPNGDITMNSGQVVLVRNGTYTGPSNWGSNVAALKTPPTTVYRYEAALGGAGDVSFTNIRNLIASGGTGSGSILYKNFQALKRAVPGIDAINDDDENTYDLDSSTRFGQMLGVLGYKVALAPYNNQSFWVQLKRNLGSICDIVYLQCYEGGAGNDPGQWGNAFGGGFRVMPGINSNDAGSANSKWFNWSINNATTGGFFWPDVAWYPGANWGPNSITTPLGGLFGRSYACQLANLNSGLLLNAATASNGNPATNDPINQWINTNNNQIWTLNPSPNSGSPWFLTYYTNSSQAMSTITGQSGGGLRLYPWFQGTSQEFNLIAVPGWPSFYTVKFADGYALDVKNSGTTAGTAVQEYTPNNSGAQAWQLRFNPQTGY